MRKLMPRLAVVLCVVASAIALGDDFELDWWTVDGGGDMFTAAGDFELSGTIGQPDAGVTMTGGLFELTGGFWAGPTPYAVGDVNCDGTVNLFDIDPFVLALVSSQNGVPEEYYAVYPGCDIMLADLDGDGSVGLFDIDPLVGLLVD